MTANETITAPPTISVIVPARNEEASLGACLESLVSQTGVTYEIIVIDDHSTDLTREIANSFVREIADHEAADHGAPDASSGVARKRNVDSPLTYPLVRVIEAGPLPSGWTGKNNAVAAGARAARGEWLLFTDADTVHIPGSLARALAEAKENSADLLSYSPEQIAVTFWEMATLPVVFAELARQYPPSKVSDPNSPLAAANGQYILITRAAYDAVGGHAAIAKEILEDVALARAVKASGRKIRFRYAADAVRTRMYRNFHQLREGWTKNLALLFPNPGWLAVKTLRLWAMPWIVLIFRILVGASTPWWWSSVFVAACLLVTMRLRRANFDWIMEVLGAVFGMPMFAYLLLRSRNAHDNGNVPWKGRTYAGEDINVVKVPDHSSTTAGRLS
jgi:glycosyltransferase involved in cell wall biosynthesis